MKRELDLRRPVMNAAGSLGFAPATRRDSAGSNLVEFGAFVTSPVSLRPRKPTTTPACIEYPGGFLLHTGLPNHGFEAVLRRFAPRWARAETPVIVHLIADRPEETRQMVRALETTENVMAVELGFGPLLADDILRLTVELCRGEMPLVCCVARESLLRIGPRLIEDGAEALSMAAPRGSVRAPSGDGTLTPGRLFGPAIFPLTVELTKQAAKLGLPVIAAGGVWRQSDIDVLLEAGALAVQVDAWNWLPAL